MDLQLLKLRKVKRWAMNTMLACSLSAAPACSLPGNSAARESVKSGSPKSVLSEPNAGINFSLTNYTGVSFRGVYISPHTSNGWEENVVSGTELKDGNTVDIRFDPNEKTTSWDLRVEGANGLYTEWKDLNLGNVSEIRIKLVLGPEQRPLAVAELQSRSTAGS